jgi:hypothetical protein
MKKALIVIMIASAVVLMGATVVGYQDWQLRGSAPPSPSSGWLRMWADTTAGKFKCLTSAGAACYFDSAGSGPTLKTGGVTNGSQTVLNLVAGSGISMVDNGSGSITIGLTPPIVNAALRSTVSTTSGANNYTLGFPGGTAVGDLAVLFIEQGYQTITTPSGWTAVHMQASGGAYGGVFSKILTSGDLSGVSIGPTGFSSSLGMAAIFIGSTGGLRETAISCCSAATSVTGTVTSGNVLATDFALYFAGEYSTTTNVTVSRGTQKQQISGTTSAALFAETLTAAGAITPNFLYSTAGGSGYQATVIIKGL